MSVRPRSSHSCEPVPCWRACIKPVALTVVSVAARLDVGQSFIPGQLLMLDITTLSRASRSGTWFLLRRQRPFENSRQQKGVVVSLGTLKARRGDDSLDVGLDGNDFADFLEEDDIGLGVSNTVKNKTPRTPNPEELLEPEDVILELATAAQEVADALKPEDEFDKYKGRKGDEDGEATARATVMGEEVEDDGMGVSETVIPGNELKATLREEGIASRAVATIQSAEQIKEMERLAAKDVRRAEMLEKGLSKEQIAAYLGDDLSQVPKSRAERIGDITLEAYQKAAVEEASAWREEQALLQVVPSSSLVKLDENGEPFEDRFVYVDEYTCIGCTHCSHVAPSTFFMEDEYGRARVYQQGKDTEEAVCEAILTCPVDCIHYVDWPELQRLEKEREGIDINFKAKLVGNDHDNRANGMQLISGNQGMRCENCPSKGCYNCPMFGVGVNPEYKRRQEERKAKREARLKKQQEEISGEVRSADL